MQVNVRDNRGSGIWNDSCACASGVELGSALTSSRSGWDADGLTSSFLQCDDEDIERVPAASLRARDAHGMGVRGAVRVL